MKANQKQFLYTVLAGVTTMAVWELYIKPKVLVQQQPETSLLDYWPF